MNRYHFLSMASGVAMLRNSVLRTVTLRSAEASLVAKQNGFGLKLQCFGQLFFDKMSADFDPLSYGIIPEIDMLTGEISNAEQFKHEGLPFSNLSIQLRIEGNSVCDYRISYSDVKVSHHSLGVRKESFAEAFPPKTITFLMSESATPKQMGYDQIISPIKPSPLQKKWSGLVYRIELVNGMHLRILFAYSYGEKPGFYCGALIEAFGSPRSLSITVASLFRIGFQSLALKTHSKTAVANSPHREKGQKYLSYQILLKGLSIGMLGLSMPSGGCDIAILSGRDEKNNLVNAWYACYDNRKEAHYN